MPTRIRKHVFFAVCSLAEGWSKPVPKTRHDDRHSCCTKTCSSTGLRASTKLGWRKTPTVAQGNCRRDAPEHRSTTGMRCSGEAVLAQGGAHGDKRHGLGSGCTFSLHMRNLVVHGHEILEVEERGVAHRWSKCEPKQFDQRDERPAHCEKKSGSMSGCCGLTNAHGVARRPPSPPSPKSSHCRPHLPTSLHHRLASLCISLDALTTGSHDPSAVEF